jgi:hypothetical protein
MSYNASYILSDLTGSDLTCLVSFDQGLTWTTQGGLPGTIELAGDICADPTRPGYVFALSDSTPIYFSSDFGSSFSPAGGIYTQSGLKRIVSFDSTVFVAVGSTIAVSINGGSIFNDLALTVTDIYGSSATANAVHMINNTTWIVGINDKLYKTTDSGISWIALNSSNPLSVDIRVTSIQTNPLGQKIWVTTQDGIYYSSNYGVTFINQEDFTEFPVVASLSRYSDSILYAIGYADVGLTFDTRLYYTTDGSNWSYYQYTGNVPTDEYQSDIYVYNATTFITCYRSEDTFYSVDGGENLTSIVISGKPGSVDGANYPSYRLYNCDDETDTIDTIQDLAGYVQPSLVVRLEEYPDTCWQVGIYTEQVLTSFEEVTIDGDPFTSCSECIPIYYSLTDCASEETIYALPSEELLENEDLVVKIEGETGCYLVKKFIGFTDEILEEVTITQGGYADCTCCLPQPVPEPEVFVRTTQAPVKQFYHITDTECEIKTNSQFAENYYKLFLGMAYGIANCCTTINFDKLWIKQELSEYSRINPPDACIVPVIEETILDCPTTVLVSCGIPTDVSGTGDFS